MKILLPTLKERSRYVLYEVKSDIKLNFKDVKDSISEGVLRFLGELECAKASILIMDDWVNNKGIIKVNNKYVDKLRVALMLIKYINKKDVIIQTIKVTGTLKKSRSFLKGG